MSFTLKLIVTTIIAIVLVGLYGIVALNIIFAGVLNKGFILSVIGLPFLVFITIKLNNMTKEVA